MIKKDIILYYKYHYDPDCFCSYCVNKKGIISSLQKLGYSISIKKFNCDWEYFKPAEYHFDYALAYQNKIFGEFMFEADKMPLKVIEFAQTYFDYIICGSKFLYITWLNSGVDKKFLIPASLGLDTEIFNTDNCRNDIYPNTFKFLTVGAWQHSNWQDRKGLQQLIGIFKRLYSENDKVMLIIKTTGYAPIDVGVNNIKIIRDKYSDLEMAHLYKSCALNGAFISLHKGEGFGRCSLEALCSGCTIGATGWSGVLDFLNKDNATLFPYTFIKSNLHPSNFYVGNIQPNVAQVDTEAVKKWMLNITGKKLGVKLTGNIERYSWDSVVKDLMYKINNRL